MHRESVPQTIFTEPQFLFNETMKLLEQARDYMIWSRHMRLTAAVAGDYTLESSRLTTRLTATMAWVMARRAVARGELSFEAGCREFRLANQDVCAVDRSAELGPELEELADLLRASLDLYRRVASMDAALDRAAPAERVLASA